MAVTRHTISIDEKVSKDGVKRAETLKYESFSDYVEYLIRKDIDEKPKHTVVREESGVTYGDAKKAGGSNAGK